MAKTVPGEGELSPSGLNIKYYCNNEYMYSFMNKNKGEAYMPSGRKVTLPEFNREMKKTYNDMLRPEKAVWYQMKEAPTMSRPVVQCGGDGADGEQQVAHGHEFLVRNPALYGFSDNQLKDAIRIRFQYFVETRNSKTVKHSLFSDTFNVSCIKLETVYIVRPAIYGTRSTWELLHHTPLMYQPLIVNREVN
jgi:hypothetical protein